MSDYINDVLNDVKEKNLHEPEYLQAVDEVLTTIRPIVDVHPEYKKL